MFFQSLNAFSNAMSDYYSYFDNNATPPKLVSINQLTNSDVFTAVNILASDIATDPIKLEKNNVDAIKSDFTSIDYLLNVQPNSIMTAWQFKYVLTANMLLNGNGYARIIRDKQGRPASLIPLASSWVSPEISDTGVLRYTIQDATHQPYTLNSSEIIHIKYLSVNGLVGISPLYALKDETSMQRQGNKLLNDFFKQGVNGSAILKMRNVTAPDARNRVREEWQKANRDQRVVVLDTNEDYSPVEIDTSILKIVNSNDYSTRQIAKAFGIPVTRLGIENEHTSLAQANLDYVQNSLDHYFSRFTSELAMKLLTPEQALSYHFEFDVSRLMQLDTETNMKMWKDYYIGGLVSDSEAREQVGLAPFDDEMTNKRIVMSNYVPIDNIKENYPNNVLRGNAYNDTDNNSNANKLKDNNNGN